MFFNLSIYIDGAIKPFIFMQLKTFPIYLEQSFELTPKVRHFVFNCEEEPPFNFLPGQFITIYFSNEGKKLHRSYSIANQPQKDNKIEFAAGYIPDGPGTKLLFGLKPKEQLIIGGPFGRLTLKDNIPKRYIFVATSTGVTPYRSMLAEMQKRLEQNSDLNIVIIQGVQKSADVLYREEFTNFAKNCNRVDFRMHLSKETQFKDNEYAGYVQTAFPQLNLNPTEDIIYLCGNPSMIDDSFTYLLGNGFTTQQIIREKYISK